MKFDMGQAWSDATGMLGNNRDLILIIAGVFFFLPYFALMLFLPSEMGALQNPSAGADPEAMTAMIVDFYANAWWIFVLLALVQAVGIIGLLVLLTDRSRPTLGEALSVGVKYLPTYIGVQLLQTLVILVVLFGPVAIAAAAGSTLIAVLLGIAAFVGFIYIFTKFSLATPVVAVERTGNPITALKRSWGLTKGNSLRIFLFYVLLFLALMVISLIISMVGGLIFAFMGAQIAMIGNGFVSGIVNAVFATIFAAVLAATHRQLAGDSPASVSETFG